jgi:GDP-L-fucose synthase
MDKGARIYVAGHRGMVGSAIVRHLLEEGFANLILRTHGELDLTDQAQVRHFFDDQHPEVVVFAAAKVGGLYANNTYRPDIIYENLMMACHVIHESWRSGVQKLLFLGSSCIYPKLASQPIKEADLLTGPLEPTNEPYAISKIAGVKLCESYNRQYGTRFISAMPTNLYGPNDNYDPNNSHVLPALIRKIHEAKIKGAQAVEVWGTGTPRREFLHVDDLARACLFLLNHYEGNEPINVGTGEDVTIAELAELVRSVVGYEGTLSYDRSKPDGTPRKWLDVSKIHALGWHHTIGLPEGIRSTYVDFCEHHVPG